MLWVVMSFIGVNVGYKIVNFIMYMLYYGMVILFIVLCMKIGIVNKFFYNMVKIVED